MSVMSRLVAMLGVSNPITMQQEIERLPWAQI